MVGSGFCRARRAGRNEVYTEEPGVANRLTIGLRAGIIIIITLRLCGGGASEADRSVQHDGPSDDEKAYEHRSDQELQDRPFLHFAKIPL